MLLKEEREQVVEYGKQLLERNLSVGTFGNISIYNEKENLFAISPSGMDYYKTTPEDVVICTPEGEKVEGTAKPSSELDMHRIFYQKRPEIKAVVHTHSRYADGRMEAFALCAALCGAEREVLENILGCITTDAALEILKKEGIFDETIKMLEKRIDRSLKLRAKGSIEIGMITFSEEYGILCKTENADNMLKKLK